ncbi:ABC transporter ATP-binding protein [Candidatus Hodarchaeum mangrovi]
MGFGLGLAAEEYDRKYKDIDLLRRITVYFKGYHKEMVIVIAFLTLYSLSNSFVPVLTREVLNYIEDSSGNVIWIAFSILLIFLMNFIAWISNYFRQKYSAIVIGDVVLNIRQDVNRAVLKHDLSFFDKYPTGKIVSRINTDSRDFGQTASLLVQTFGSFLVVIIMLLFLIILNIQLTLIIFGMVPFIFLVALSFRKIARKRTLEGQRALATVNSYVQETISGIQIAKTFRQEKKLYTGFIGVNDQSYLANLKRAYVFNFIFPTLSIIQGIAFGLIIWFGGMTTYNSEIKIGDLYLFLQSLILFFFPLFSIASFWPSFQAGLAASERIFALIDTPPLVLQENNRINKLKGEIDIKNLDFSYTEGTSFDKTRINVFKDFSLKIAPGESIAIVGHTGAGKSSIAKLLARFYEFQDGEILIDGISIRDFDLKKYRMQIGIIPQIPFLWNDTLENNIKYGRPNATEKEVLWALENAGGSDWMEDLPHGIKTNIRERGSLLSMGQRQLVVFARTLLENPSILILDEATASVDPFTETRIQEALEKTIKGRTSIIIAHRLWTVRHVDRIVVLDKGKIVEQGNHDDLMAKKGYYSTLYDTYFRHQSLDYIYQIREEVPDN